MGRRYHAVPKYSADSWAICQVWGTVTVSQPSESRPDLNHPLASPALSGSKRNCHVPVKDTRWVSGSRGAAGVFSSARAARGREAPSARDEAVSRNLRRVFTRRRLSCTLTPIPRVASLLRHCQTKKRAEKCAAPAPGRITNRARDWSVAGPPISVPGTTPDSISSRYAGSV